MKMLSTLILVSLLAALNSPANGDTFKPLEPPVPPMSRSGARNLPITSGPADSFITIHPHLQTKNCPCDMPSIISCTRCSLDWDEMASAEGMTFPDGSYMTRVETEDPLTDMLKFASLEDSSLNAYITRKELSPGVFDFGGTIHGLDNRVFWLNSCNGGRGVVWAEEDIKSIIESEGNDGENETEEMRRLLSEDALSRFGGSGRDTTELQRGVSDTTTIVTYSVTFHVTKPFEASVGDVEAYVDILIEETNDGYINSGIPLRIAKHCIKLSDIEEEDSSSAMLTKFRSFAPVSELLDSADIAFLLVKTMSSGCGIAYTNVKSLPLGLAKEECAKGYYSFGHEIAHMFGATHNRESNPTERCPYCYGYLIKPMGPTQFSGYRSIMGYYASNHYNRVNYYSSSTGTFVNNGVTVAMGDGDTDNARILREHRFDQASIGNEEGVCIPRDGQWSDWSDWDCGEATDLGCGTSPLEVRRRSCSNPYPMNNGKECQGHNVETRPATGGICNTGTTCPVCENKRTYCDYYKDHCAVGMKYYSFMMGNCPVTCDKCHEFEKYNVDGQWTAWNEWSECTDCKRSRSRTCSNPNPVNDGLLCPGANREEVEDNGACNCNNGVKDVLMVIAGYTNTVEVIDLSGQKRTCKPVANYPGIKLYAAAASTTDGRPVVCGGGMINYSNREKCYAFDPSTSGWVSFASMPEQRTLMEGVSVGDEGDFIIVGGTGFSNKATMTRYSAASNSFGTPEPIPRSMIQHCVRAINATHNIVATAGVQNYIHEAATGVFTPIADKHVAAATAACGVIKSAARGVEFIIAGANGASPASKKTAIYNFEDDTWRAGPDLPLVGLKRPTSHNFGDNMIIVGGVENYPNSFIGEKTILEFDAASEKWIVRSEELARGRFDHVAVLVTSEMAKCT